MPPHAVVRVGAGTVGVKPGIDGQGVVHKGGVVGGDEPEVILESVMDRERRNDGFRREGRIEGRRILGQDAEYVEQWPEVFLCCAGHAQHAAVAVARAVLDAHEEVFVFALPEGLQRTPSEPADDLEIMGVAAVLIADLVRGRIRDVAR